MGNYFKDIEQELLGQQDEKQESLHIKEQKEEPKTVTKKVDLHVTIPKATKDKLDKCTKERHLSASVLIQLLIDENC